jgi:membrane-associated protein
VKISGTVAFLPALLPFTSLSLSDQILSFGIWVYLLIFVIILLASTIAGGVIPDNTFLFLAGAVAAGNSLSVEWLLVAAVCGGFAGYEINYWSGRLLGLTICQRSCPRVLNDKHVRRALELMDKFGPVSLIISRFLPVLNLPSFIAGISSMKYPRYLAYNLFSALIWCGVLLATGYFIGNISLIEAYLDYITDLFIVIMAATVIISVLIFVRDYYNG